MPSQLLSLAKSISTRIERLDLADLDAIVKLQAAVIPTLVSEEIFVPFSLVEFTEILESNAIVLGLSVESQLVGVLIATFPGEHPCNLGYDLNFSSEAIKQVVHFEGAFVHPDFRGHRFHLKLTEAMEEIFKREDPECTRIRYLCSTVSPINYPSLSKNFRIGMHIAALTYKYGGRLRYILLKDLLNPTLEIDRINQVVLDTGETQEQQRLLANGYHGFHLSREESFAMKVHYAPRIINFSLPWRK